LSRQQGEVDRFLFGDADALVAGVEESREGPFSRRPPRHGRDDRRRSRGPEATLFGHSVRLANSSRQLSGERRLS
jgi:hypothetical protein